MSIVASVDLLICTDGCFLRKCVDILPTRVFTLQVTRMFSVRYGVRKNQSRHKHKHIQIHHKKIGH